MKSKPYKLDGRLFRYDYDRCVVEYIYKASAEDIKEEQEWIAEHGRPLLDIDADGYSVVDSVGLRKENWDNREARREYLGEWSAELDEEAKWETYYFEKYELPYLN